MKIKFTLAIAAALFFSSVKNLTAQCLSGNCNNGIGTFIWSSGDTYTGEYYNGVRTGLGEYVWDDGNFYFGHFINGKLDGKGYYQDADGKVQSGIFSDGVLSTSYTIEFNDECITGDCSSGIGIYLWKSGSSYIGEWSSGVQNGYGRMDWDDGSYYYGYFRNNKLNGNGYYHSAEGKVMDGSFIDGVFQGTTKTDSYSDDNQPAAPAAPAESKTDSGNSLDDMLEQSKKNDEAKKNYHPAEYDFCTMMQKVIADYPNGFASLKGPKDGSPYSFGDTYWSNARVTGSLDASVSKELLGDNSTWYCTLYEGESRTAALAKYNDYVSQFKTCGVSCCTLVSDVSDYKGDGSSSYESKMTYYLTFMLRDDSYSEKYKKMEVDIEFSSKILDDGFQIVARVKTL